MNKRGLDAPEVWQVILFILALMLIFFVLMWTGVLGEGMKQYLDKFFDFF